MDNNEANENTIAKRLLTVHKAESDAFNRALTAMANKPDSVNVTRVRQAVLTLIVAVATNTALDDEPCEDPETEGADNGKPEPEENETEDAEAEDDEDADAGDDETPRSSQR